MAKKVLVNGVDGFIASHLTEYLVEQGLRVKVFIYYCSFNSHGWLDTIDEMIKKQNESFSSDATLEIK